MAEQQTRKSNVIITGASSGIGEETANLFAEKGFRVFGTSRREHPDYGDVEMLRLDVCSDDSVQHFIKEIFERVDGIDVLVNNAGIAHKGFAEETTMEEARKVFETNFFGVMRLTNAVLPGMRARRQGRIINVGSLAGCIAVPDEAFYSASKHALAGYTEALRQEVWPLGLHVSLVEPSFFKTNIHEAPTKSDDTIADYDAARRAIRKVWLKGARQADDPHKVAQLILKIAMARAPRLRYGAGREGIWVPRLKAFLPQWAFEWVLHRRFGLTKIRDDGEATD